MRRVSVRGSQQQLVVFGVRSRVHTVLHERQMKTAPVQGEDGMML